MKTILFFSNIQDVCSEDTFVAYIPINIATEEGLFAEFNKQLCFPYFGFNWDALYDLLCDFHWITQAKIIIVHNDIPLLKDKESFYIYIDLLFDAINAWERVDTTWENVLHHNLEVYFPIEFQEQINSCINEIMSKKQTSSLDSVD